MKFLTFLLMLLHKVVGSMVDCMQYIGVAERTTSARVTLPAKVRVLDFHRSSLLFILSVIC